MSDADVTEARGAGFFGKLPSRGDFVNRNLPRDFVTGLDDWLQHAMLASREILQDDWLNCYLRSPIWRFVLPADVLGESGWCGVLMPSVDRVNRYFPLVIAAPAPRACPSFALKDHNGGFFDEGERLLILALEDDDLDLEDFAARVAVLRLAPGTAAESGIEAQLPAGAAAARVAAPAAALNHALLDALCRNLRDPYSIWWTAGDDGREHLLLLDGLPRHQDYVDLIAGGIGPVEDVEDVEEDPDVTTRIEDPGPPA